MHNSCKVDYKQPPYMDDGTANLNVPSIRQFWLQTFKSAHTFNDDIQYQW